VIIAAHGYTATTFEWDELREFADSARTFMCRKYFWVDTGALTRSLKLLTEGWQSSIVNEYVKLHLLGFRNIYLAGSSTGAPLGLQCLIGNVYKLYKTAWSISD
jgi:carboxylesterase